MWRLLYQLFLQRFRQFHSEWRRDREKQFAPVRKRSGRRFRLAAAVSVGIAGLGILLVFNSYDFRFARNLSGRDGATLVVELNSIISAPAIAYMERWPPQPHVAQPSREAANLLIENNVFKPKLQVVQSGGSINIENRDSILHNAHVTIDDDTVFNVATPLRSIPVQKSLATTGMLRVRCDLHPWMQAWIFVPPSAHYEVLHRPNRVRWSAIEPGRYRLVVWQDGEIPREFELTLTSGGSETVRIP